MKNWKKIVGLSEPSAYRMGAQNYIEANVGANFQLPPNKLSQDSNLTRLSLNSLKSRMLQRKVQTVMQRLLTPPRTPGQNRYNSKGDSKRQVTH